MSKLYTKTGDKGTTCLYDMRRVSKGDKLIDALGDIDELSAHIGLLCSKLRAITSERDGCPYPKTYCPHKLTIAFLRTVQSCLLDIGSLIATSKREKRTTRISESQVKEVEGLIDSLEQKNTPLKEFILPGVNVIDAQSQVCRVICRKAERKVVNLAFDEELNRDSPYVDSEVLQYLNRLSDYFFALSRSLSGCEETRRSEI